MDFSPSWMSFPYFSNYVMFLCATYFNNSEWIWPIWPQPDFDVVGAGIGRIGRVSDRDIAAIGDRDGRQKKNSAGRWQMCQRWLFTIPNGALVGNTVKSTRCISKCVFGWPDSFFALGLAWEPKMASGKADGKRWKKNTKYWGDCSLFQLHVLLQQFQTCFFPRWCLWTSGLRIHDLHHYWIDTNTA